MLRIPLVAWVHANATDGVVYGGDKAALDKGFVDWPEAMPPSQMALTLCARRAP